MAIVGLNSIATWDSNGCQSFRPFYFHLIIVGAYDKIATSTSLNILNIYFTLVAIRRLKSLIIF
jgi:hypothetical protein